MADDKKLYRVTVPSADYDEIWDENDITGFDGLKKEYSDAKIEVAKPNGRYSVSVPSANYTEEWSADDYTGFENLKKDYPDAVAKPLYDYSPYETENVAENAQDATAAADNAPSMDNDGQFNDEPQAKTKGESQEGAVPNDAIPFGDVVEQAKEDLFQAPEGGNVPQSAINAAPAQNVAQPQQIAQTEQGTEAENAASQTTQLGRDATMEDYDSVLNEYNDLADRLTAGEKTINSLDERYGQLTEEYNALVSPYGRKNENGEMEYSLPEDIYAKANAIATEMASVRESYLGEIDSYNAVGESIKGNPVFQAESDRGRLGDIAREISALRKHKRNGTMPEDSPFDKGSLNDRIRQLKKERKELQKKLGENGAVKYIDQDMISEIDGMRENLAELRDSYPRHGVASRAAANPMAMGTSAYYDPQDQLLDRQYKTADDLYRRAQKILNSSYKYNGKIGKGFKGAGMELADPDFWDQGLSEIEDNIAVRTAYEKLEAGEELTPLEEETINAYTTYQLARAQRAYDTATTFKGGEGAADMAMLAVTMSATSALGGKAISEATKRKLMKLAVKPIVHMAPKSATGKAIQFAAKEGTEWLISEASDLFGKTLVYVTMTPAAARTGSELALEMDENGKLARTEAEAYGNAYAREIITMQTMNSPAKLLRSFSDAARTVGKFTNSEAVEKWYRDYMKSVGRFSDASEFNYALHSVAGPYAMLKSAAITQIAMKDEEALANFFDGENMGALLLSLVPGQVMGLAKMEGARVNYNQERARFEQNLKYATADLLATDINSSATRTLFDALRTLDVKSFLDDVRSGKKSPAELDAAVDRYQTLKSEYDALEKKALNLESDAASNGKFTPEQEAAYDSVLELRADARSRMEEAENDIAKMQVNKALDALGDAELRGLFSGLTERLSSSEMSLQESIDVLSKVFNLVEAAAAYQTVDGLYQGEFRQRLDTKQAEIEEAVPGQKIWHTEKVGNVSDKFVTTVEFDGREMFVAEPNPQSGDFVLFGEGDSQVTIVPREVLFAENAVTRNGAVEGTQEYPLRTVPLREYLSRRLMADEITAKGEQMRSETASKYNIGDEINLPPTEEGGEGRMGVVVDADQNGIRVDTPEGEERYTYDDLAAMNGDKIVTDAEVEAADGIAQANQDKAVIDTEKNADAQIQVALAADVLPVKGLVSAHVKDGTFNPETGEMRIIAHDAEGNEIQFDIDKQTLQNAIDEIEEAADDAIIEGAENAIPEQTTQEQVAEQPEQAVAEPEAPKYEIPRQENGDIDYDKLAEENPEEFYVQAANEFGRDVAKSEIEKKYEAAQKAFDNAPMNKKSQAARDLAKWDAVRKTIAEPEPVAEKPVAEAKPVMASPVSKRDQERREAQEQADKDFHLVTEKWDAAPKVEGNVSSTRVGDRKVKGKYVLVEADGPTASHDPYNNFQPSKGFPMVEGLSANSRDYTDPQTRKSTELDAQKFNEKALHETSVVTRDGVVISGNGRTIMSQIAAKNGTDAEYLEALNEEAANYGFTPEQIAQFKHPRVYFQVDPSEEIEYSVSTFHEFNKADQKTESKSEVAQRDGRILSEDKNTRYLGNIIDTVSQYDKLSDAAKSPKATADVTRNMIQAGIISDKDIPRMVATKDGTGTKEFVEKLENALLGTALDGETLKILVDYDYPHSELVKEAVVRALPAITIASQHPEEYNLKDAFNDAIALIYGSAKFAAQQKLNVKDTDIIFDFLNDESALFARETTYSLDAIILASLIWDNHNKKGKNISDAITAYNDVVLRATANNDMESMFGDEEKVTIPAQDILKKAIFDVTNREYGPEQDRATDSGDSGVGNDREPEGALGNVPERGAAPAEGEAKPAQGEPVGVNSGTPEANAAGETAEPRVDASEAVKAASIEVRKAAEKTTKGTIEKAAEVVAEAAELAAQAGDERTANSFASAVTTLMSAAEDASAATKAKSAATRAELAGDAELAETHRKSAEQSKGRAERFVADAAQMIDKAAQRLEGAEEPKAEKPKKTAEQELDDEIADLERQLKEKFGNLNSGIDPETLSITTKLTFLYAKKGILKLAEVAKKLIDTLGDKVRPYITTAYYGARNQYRADGDMETVKKMSTLEEIDAFDAVNFGKKASEPVDLMKTAEIKAGEAQVKEIAKTEENSHVKYIDGLNLQPGDKYRNSKGVTIEVAKVDGDNVTINGTGGGRNLNDVSLTKEQLYSTMFGHSDKFKKVEGKSEEPVVEAIEESSEDTKNVDSQFVDAVSNSLIDAVAMQGEKPFKSINDIRQVARSLGLKADESGRDDVKLQELVELGIVNAAREIVSSATKQGRDTKTIFDRIVKLYEAQPTIGRRDSNKIALQQYSTPIPMAYVAGMFVGSKAKNVLEPTAGNGMLTIALDPSTVTVNEIDKARLANLKEQGFKAVTDQDGTKPFPADAKFDGVIANPPFGKSEPKEYDGKKIGGLENQIALNALESMTDNGRAAIIVGGNMEYAPNGSISNNKPFYTYLYNHYNVKGVVDMDGSLYAKQGTTYPTRMIVIDGRRSEEEIAQTTIFPPIKENAIAKVKTFDELYNTVNELLNSVEKTNGHEVLRNQETPDLPNNVKDSEPGLFDSTEEYSADDAGRQTGGRGRDFVAGNRGGVGKTSAGAKAEPAALGGQRNAGGKVSGVPAQASGTPASRPGTAEDGGVRVQSGVDGVPDVATVRGERTPVRGVGLEEQAKKLETPKQVKEERKLDTGKLPYVRHNGSMSLESVAPAAMVEAMDKTLTNLEKKHGNIDVFVAKELGYDTIDELHNALAAEQVDSVAMAIDQMQNGQALIIGDQTGVGKGRQMAALIRWAVNQGKKPIFVTKDANLFTDIYRDLADVGSGDLRPFIFNKDGAMLDVDGKKVYGPATDGELKKAYETGKIPDEYDYVVASYSQFSTGDAQSRAEMKSKKQPKHGDPKATLLRALAKDNYILLDESHTAAGASNQGAFFRSILKDAKAATFASATFAKRPDTMPLYATRTAMSKANVEQDELIKIISKGGVTLQEIMSRALTEAGQMVRRERDMSDVKTDWKTIDDKETVKRARENYDKTIEVFNDIIEFQKKYVMPKIEELDAEVAMMAETAGIKKGTKGMGVDNPPFVNKTYNYTKQLMLAIKADAVVDEIANEINAGRHPVIALESTMESAYKDDYAVGDKMQEPTFSMSLLRGLDNVMQYTVKDEDGNESHGRYKPEELGEAGEKAYYELQDKIRKATGDIFISPIDAMVEGLTKKGYRVGELTGRGVYIVHNADGTADVVKRTDKDKKKLTREFNSGKIDVLILNKTASTGISLHASRKFSDQRQRTMIIAQPLSDINDYMQMIGRIDRTGQVSRGYYINLGLPVPAETRFLMMLATKLKSLNANTTTSQESEENSVDAPDLLNKYGSQVVIEYLRDNPDVYEKMGEPLKGDNGNIRASQLDEYKPKEEDARFITGRVALLSTEEQEAFYNDVNDRYNALIKYLDDTNSNDLKITVMPLRAKTISKKVSSPGVDPNGTNPFAKDAYVEEIEMDILRKPLKAADIRKVIDNLNSDKPDGNIPWFRKRIAEDESAKLEKAQQSYDKAKARVEDAIAKFSDRIDKSTKMTADEKAEKKEEYADKMRGESLEKYNNQTAKIATDATRFLDRIKMFAVGNTYIMPDTLVAGAPSMYSVPSIFCGFKTGKKLTFSTTFAVFATLDGRQRVEVKLSDYAALATIKDQTNLNYDFARQSTLDDWDAQIPSEARTKGYMMTGNILQAIKDTMDEYGNFTGKLVTYTDIDGGVHDGVLMPSGWDASKLRSAGVPLSARLMDLKNNKRLDSTDGNVWIERAWPGSDLYILSVPKSKKVGGKYYEDRELLDLVEYGRFYQQSGEFRAEIRDRNIAQAVAKLSQLGVRVEEGKAPEDNEVKYSLITDDALLAKLNNEKKIPAYRAMQVIDGKLYPPMSAMVGGEMVEGRLPGQWEQADEHPELIKLENGIPKFVLNKGGKDATGRKATDVTARYNPYIHASKSPLNDQFKSAWIRPNMVTVRVLIPESELTSGYKAEYAKDAVGETDWKSGSVSSALVKAGKSARKVILSRYAKIDGIVEEPEVAAEIAKMLKGTDIAIPINTVTPKLRAELEKLGVKIGAPEKGVNLTEQITEAMSRGLEVDNSLMDRAGIEGAAKRTGESLGAEIIFHSKADLKGKDAKSHGWYNPKDGSVHIVSDNISNADMAVAKVFHETVAHKGLREMFGGDFNNFLDNVYSNVGKEIKKIIDGLVKEGRAKDIREATEEYLSRLAERGPMDAKEFTLWKKIRGWITDMLRKIGVRIRLTEQDLRGILTESYIRLRRKGTPLETAEDIALAEAYKESAVESHNDSAEGGNDAKGGKGGSGNGGALGERFKGESDDIRYSMLGDSDPLAPRPEAVKEFDLAEKFWKNRIKEAAFEENISVRLMQDAIVKHTKIPMGEGEDVSKALNQVSSRFTTESDAFEKKLYNPLLEHRMRILKETGLSEGELTEYMALKNGLERQIVFAQRDAREAIENKRKVAIDKENAKYDAKKDELNKKIQSYSGANAQTSQSQAMLQKAKAELAKLDADHTTEIADINNHYDSEIVRINHKDPTQKEFKDKRQNDYGAIRTWFAEYYDNNGNKLSNLPRRNDGETKVDYNIRLRNMQRFPAGFEYMVVAETRAKDRVKELENIINDGKNRTDRLWELTRAVTDYNAELQYKHGRIDKAFLESMIGDADGNGRMFEYYIPMRGFLEDTASDLYDYETSAQLNHSGERPFVRAGGRISKPESPFGFLGAIHDTSAVSGFNNDVAMSLYKFAMSHPDNGIISVSKTWYEPTGVDPNTGNAVWEPVYPPITPNMSIAQMQAVNAQFEIDEQAKKEQGLALDSRREVNLRGAAVFMDNEEKKKHAVQVFVDGKEYSIVFNGSPRAAMAINGMLKEKYNEGFVSQMYRKGLRYFSKANTSFRAAFGLSTNLQRDLMFGLQNSFVNESPEYVARYAKNLPLAMSVVPMYISGGKTAKQGGKFRTLFDDYMENGGPTGMAYVQNHEEWDKHIDRKMVMDAITDNEAGEVLKAIGHGYISLIEATEQISRFCAFMTAREMGMSMADAVDKAKRVTINFNQRGTGHELTWKEAGELLNRKGHELGGDYGIRENVMNWMARTFATFFTKATEFGLKYMPYFNAKLQSIYNQYNGMKNHFGKFLFMASVMASVGFLNALSSYTAYNSDDEEKKAKGKTKKEQGEYYRQNKLTSMPLGKSGKGLVWAVPQEWVPFVAIGDNVTRWAFGWQTGKETFVDSFNSLASEYLPIDYNSLRHNIFGVSTVLDILTNTNFMGQPVSRINPFNKDIPNFRGGTDATWQWLQSLTEAMNYATGGSYSTSGWLDFNPAYIQQFITGFGGGWMEDVAELGDVVKKAIDPNADLSVNDFPIAGNWVIDYDNQWTRGETSEQYNYFYDEAMRAKHNLSDAKKVSEAEMKKVMEGENMGFYNIFHGQYESQMKKIQDIINTEQARQPKPRENELRKLYRQRNELRQKFVDDCLKYHFSFGKSQANGKD